MDCVSVEEERVFHNLSTTYQQIVDNVGKDIHGTHRGFYPQYFTLLIEKKTALVYNVLRLGNSALQFQETENDR